MQTLSKHLISAKSLKPAKSTLKMYPPDTVIFDRASVSLQLPDALYTNIFFTAVNVSKSFGNLIKNSFRRSLYFAWLFKPIFGDALMIDVVKQMSTTTSTNVNNIGATTLKPNNYNTHTSYE